MSRKLTDVQVWELRACALGHGRVSPETAAATLWTLALLADRLEASRATSEALLTARRVA